MIHVYILEVVLACVALGGMNEKMYYLHKLNYFERMDGQVFVLLIPCALCVVVIYLFSVVLLDEKRKIFTLNFRGFVPLWDCRMLSDLPR